MTAITVVSPSSGKELGEVTAHTAEDTRQAFDRARPAQRRWQATPVKERRKVLLKLHDLVLERRDEILDLIQDETGKNRTSAFEEVMDVAITARHCGYAAGRLLRPKRAKTSLPGLTRTRVEHDPVGVVGMISPWNYPFSLTAGDAIAALAMGNAVVLKPDSQTPYTGLLVADLLREAGLPENVFQAVTGSGSVVGQEIVAQCDYLMFTGSTATGRKLGEQAGERLIGYSAELGGKNPMIIADDADLERTVPGARAACFSNSGQLCISIERLYVHRGIADEFIPAFVDSVAGMRIGGGHDWETDMGSLISEEHCEHVAAMVDDAVAKGARVLTGGRRLTDLGPTFYAPTLLADVPEDAELFREETFGPVVAVEVVDSLDEAVLKANDTRYGLNASVWANPATGSRLASRLHAGTVNVNEGFAAAWSSVGAPMGGWKDSGVGRRHGDGGMLKYTEARTVAVQHLMSISGNTLVDPDVFAKTVTTALKFGKRILR